jgi:hypothetical protein
MRETSVFSVQFHGYKQIKQQNRTLIENEGRKKILRSDTKKTLVTSIVGTDGVKAEETWARKIE